MSTLGPSSSYWFYTDNAGNQYYCIPGSSTEDISGTITIPSNLVPKYGVLVGGGGGCSTLGLDGYCPGAGSGGFYLETIVSGSYNFTVGTGGRYTTSLIDGNPTVFSNRTSQGGQSVYGGSNGGNGGNAGGGGSYGGTVFDGGSGGNITGQIGVLNNGGLSNTVNAGGGGAVFLWGGSNPQGQNATGSKAGNGGGGGGIGAMGTTCGGGGGGYLGGNGSSRLNGSVPTGGRGYGAGGASSYIDGGLGGGGGGFDPRILYVYANGVPVGFNWSSSAINDFITGNGDLPTAFLSGTTAGGGPVVLSEATVIGNPGALFFVLQDGTPTTTTTTAPTTTTTRNPVAPPCFVKGTRILTPSGYKKVEDLQSRDHVQTADKRSVPIKIFTFTIEKATNETAPYKIPAGALGPGTPKRDVHVSPRHAVKDSNGSWQIPKYLGEIATQYGIGESVTYYHVECPDFYRDNLLVEEMEVESYKHKQGSVGVVYMWDERKGGWDRVPPGKMKTIPVNPSTYMVYCS